MTLRKHWHLQTCYLYSYILLFVVLQSELMKFDPFESDSLQNEWRGHEGDHDDKVLSAIDHLFSANIVTGTFIHMAVMYREMHYNKQAKNKFKDEANVILAIDKIRRSQMLMYMQLQHEVQNAMIAIEGTVAGMLSAMLGNEVVSPDEGAGNAGETREDEVVTEMKNVLSNVIFIKRSIHHHDMIRQINDRNYITRSVWESMDDIISMLTEGEKNVCIKYRRGIERINGKIQPTDFCLDADALCFIMADAIRNAKKYGPQDQEVTICFDYDGDYLTVDCQNKVNPLKYKPLTHQRIKQIFAREADQALKGFVSSNLGLPAAYDAARFLPNITLNFYDNHLDPRYGVDPNFNIIVHFEVKCKCKSRRSEVYALHLPAHIVGFAIDDSLVARRTSALLLEKVLKLDKVTLLGETKEEVLSAIPKILGVEEGYEMAGIVLLDQNIDFSDGARILGTNIAKILHDEGYNGLVVILTANASRSDVALYMKVPGVDCVCGKHMTTTQKRNVIMKSWHRKRNDRRPRKSWVPAMHATELY